MGLEKNLPKFVTIGLIIGFLDLDSQKRLEVLKWIGLNKNLMTQNVTFPLIICFFLHFPLIIIN